MPEKAKDPRPPNEILLIALLLRVGGHTLNAAEIERAKTHVLTVEEKDGETVIGAVPAV